MVMTEGNIWLTHYFTVMAPLWQKVGKIMVSGKFFTALISFLANWTLPRLILFAFFYHQESPKKPCLWIWPHLVCIPFFFHLCITKKFKGSSSPSGHNYSYMHVTKDWLLMLLTPPIYEFLWPWTHLYFNTIKVSRQTYPFIIMASNVVSPSSLGLSTWT